MDIVLWFKYHKTMTEIRDLAPDLYSFLKPHLQSANYSVYQLAGDASARKYYRIIDNEKTYVLMQWEPFNEETYPFISVQRHFKEAQVNVPEIIASCGKTGVLLLEDLGDLTLERKYWESSQPENSWHFYQKALDEIIKIHTKATQLKINSTAKQIEFDVPKFVWELNYAKDNLIEGLLNYKLSPNLKTEVDLVFKSIAETLYQEPKVICHRDYHSRNLMIKLNDIYVIDFQDARMGPVQYDLVSLLKDSYVDISDEYAEKMLQYYFDNCQNLVKRTQDSYDNFYNIYELQSIQRCFKACGSFSSFMNSRQDRRYLKYLTPTLKRVMKSLSYFPEYKVLSDVIIDSGALEKNYGQL